MRATAAAAAATTPRPVRLHHAVASSRATDRPAADGRLAAPRVVAGGGVLVVGTAAGVLVFATPAVLTGV